MSLQALRTALLRLVVLGVVLAAPTTPPVAAQNGPPELIRDARAYADDNGVTMGEAVRRLRLQERAGRLAARLAEQEPETFAGLRVEHGRRFRIRARFTRNGAAALARANPDGEVAAETETDGAARSLRELEAEQASLNEAVRAAGVPFETYIDVGRNAVVLNVTDRTPVESLIGTGVVPPAVIVEVVDALVVPEAAAPRSGWSLVRRSSAARSPAVGPAAISIYGGVRLDVFPGVIGNYATSGFAVRNSSNTRGIVTAAHNGVDLEYSREYRPPSSTYDYASGIPMSAQPGARQSGSYDVRWFTVPGHSPTNKVWDGAVLRNITATRLRAQIVQGDYVCKYGTTTGYTCGYVVTRNHVYTPTGGAPGSTYVLVEKAGSNLSEKGDSGGPWFISTTAVGMHVGGAGDRAVFMPVDYINGIGVTVLTTP